MWILSNLAEGQGYLRVDPMSRLWCQVIKTEPLSHGTLVGEKGQCLQAPVGPVIQKVLSTKELGGKGLLNGREDLGWGWRHWAISSSWDIDWAPWESFLWLLFLTPGRETSTELFDFIFIVRIIVFTVDMSRLHILSLARVVEGREMVWVQRWTMSQGGKETQKEKSLNRKAICVSLRTIALTWSLPLGARRQVTKTWTEQKRPEQIENSHSQCQAFVRQRRLRIA